MRTAPSDTVLPDGLRWDPARNRLKVLSPTLADMVRTTPTSSPASTAAGPTPLLPGRQHRTAAAHRGTALAARRPSRARVDPAGIRIDIHNNLEEVRALPHS